MKKRRIKVSNIIFYGIFLFVFLCLFGVVINLAQGVTPNFFGYHFYVIETDSMEPTYPVKSIVLARKNDSYEKLDCGEVITFTFIEGVKIPNTHRIIGFYYIDKDGNYNSTYDYETQEAFYQENEESKIVGYRTKGDNPDYDKDLKPVMFSDIQSICIRKANLMGAIYHLLVSSWGFFIIIVIPSLLIIIIQIYSYVSKSKKEKLKKELKAEEEKLKEKEKEIKEKAIKEYLDSLKNK